MQQEQLYPITEDRYAGVRALWLKVIIRAIFDWVTYRDSPKIRERKLAEQAQLWLFKSANIFNSFEGICEFLDVPVEKVRAVASSMTREQVAKIEHLERESGAIFRSKLLGLLRGNEEI